MGYGDSSAVVVAIYMALASLGLNLNLGAAIDTITSSTFLRDPDSLVSSGDTFRLGFFSPNGSKYRYVGIWYNLIPLRTTVWVANRNKPLRDSSGILTISHYGNLVLLDGKQEVVWSSNVLFVSNGAANHSIARLTVEGNLVLQDRTNGSILWESFQQPSDTLLPGMALCANDKTLEKTLLTSWANSSSPSVGSFSSGLNIGLSAEGTQLFTWHNNQPHWRSGYPNGQRYWVVVAANTTLLADGSRYYCLYFPYSNRSITTNILLNSEGQLYVNYWDDRSKMWISLWERPGTNPCEVYGFCGPFGICNTQSSPICSCVEGFEPKNAQEWKKGNWTSGCVRQRSLQCERKQNGSEVGQQDEFLKLECIKLPDQANSSSYDHEQGCINNCSNSCSCIACAYQVNAGCIFWSGNLMDMQKLSPAQNNCSDLYIRLAYSEFDRKSNINVIIIIMVIIGALAIVVSVFFLWRWMAKLRERMRKREELLKLEQMLPTVLDRNKNPVKLEQVTVLDLQKLADATENFDVSNRLGQGGFGIVYKGKLPDGQEIAVKRLSRASGQGLDEFMNEVVVISKLQHRNLVKLLGCCVETEEKMLVYEYMPNKSLDSFLFDREKQKLLDLKKRFNIMEGICRGLLYLHRDSRLKIIHRDLKTGNILLDRELNPKISDFGMARIFGGNEDQAKTRRIVGTYGYMSPEYAIHGNFSEKSDVFSLGVLFLEIVSGRRNTSFYENESLTLLGLAWKLWNERKIMELVDPVIFDPQYEMDICRCVHVGLLCVQEFAKDRPSMPSVISMLNNEIEDLPYPNKPAFTLTQHVLGGDSSQRSQNRSSVNEMTTSVVQGR